MYRKSPKEQRKCDACHPLFVGGSPSDLLFGECATTRLTLIDTQPLASGNVILSYRVGS